MGRHEKNTLWTNFVDGDKNAFAQIYNEHVDILFKYGSKICRDRDFLKDCIQDVFVDLFHRRKQLSVPYNLKFYLFKVLKNVLIKKLKKERRFGDLSERNDFTFQTEYCIEKHTIHKEIQEAKLRLLQKTLESLTSKQKEILYLRFNMGFNYMEISEITKIDHSFSVRKQVYRAIKKLRESEFFRTETAVKFDMAI